MADSKNQPTPPSLPALTAVPVEKRATSMSAWLPARVIQWCDTEVSAEVLERTIEDECRLLIAYYCIAVYSLLLLFSDRRRAAAQLKVIFTLHVDKRPSAGLLGCALAVSEPAITTQTRSIADIAIPPVPFFRMAEFLLLGLH
jgi:hypothetical protein